MNLAALLAERRIVLLDFDGPMCAVFGGELTAPEVAKQLTQAARRNGVNLPADLNAADDPFDVLRAAARCSPEDAAQVEQLLRDAEVRAVATAPITGGLRAMLTALRDSGHTTVVVSNNSSAAIRAFVAAHDPHDLIQGVVARTEPDPGLLKPNPHLVQRAIRENSARPEHCVLIGDSTTDVTAAQRAGTASIGYANKPGKLDALIALHPDAIITHLDVVTHAATTPQFPSRA